MARDDASAENLAPVGERPPVPMSIARVLGIVGFLAIVIFWIWVFANRGSIAHPDEFDDAGWVTAAESLCAERQAVIAELPNPATVDGPVERGELVRLGTRELEAMVAGLENLGLPADAQGAETVPQWLTDYEIYLQDRRNWADILVTGDDPPFRLSAGSDGARVTDLLSTFAEVNDMPSCAPSGDA
ncbi:MAG: hypothetical protein AAF567_05830 [Actinomycetota bacterium]